MLTVTILVVPVFSPLCNLAFALRRAVFIDEQQVEDEEFDAHDLSATHFVVIVDGAVVGTLRLIETAEHMKIGRVAVAKSVRGLGIGRQLMQHAMDHARAAGHTRFALNAQHDKTGFYETFGFHPVSAPADDGSGIPHVEMRTY
jgi:predicted GNAT family N-acyltransferase